MLQLTLHKKKDQLLSFKRKRPYLSGSLSLRTSCTLKNNNTTNCFFFFLNCFLLLMHLSLIVELPAKTERNIKMATRYDSENLFNILVGSIWKHLQEMDRKGKENTTENFSDTIFTVKTLLHCTLSSNWEEKKSFTPHVTKQRVKVPITGDKLVVHFSSLPLVFLYTISLKLDRILLSLFLLSSWLNDARARFSSAL